MKAKDIDFGGRSYAVEYNSGIHQARVEKLVAGRGKAGNSSALVTWLEDHPARYKPIVSGETAEVRLSKILGEWTDAMAVTRTRRHAMDARTRAMRQRLRDAGIVDENGEPPPVGTQVPFEFAQAVALLDGQVPPAARHIVVAALRHADPSRVGATREQIDALADQLENPSVAADMLELVLLAERDPDGARPRERDLTAQQRAQLETRRAEFARARDEALAIVDDIAEQTGKRSASKDALVAAGARPEHIAALDMLADADAVRRFVFEPDEAPAGSTVYYVWA